MTQHENNVLVVGAGPTGSAASLFLADHGFPVRIVDKAAAPAVHSKAFGVNPRTLRLLDATGVTEHMLEEGWKLRATNMHRNGKILFRVDLTHADPRFPFMLILPQWRSEALLREALSLRGVEVEWNTELETLSNTEIGVEYTLKHLGNRTETATANSVLGSDGAHSVIRKRLGTSFPGYSYPEPWYLFDLELEVSLQPNEAHIFLFDDGGMFVLRLYDNVWRIAGSVADGVDRLPTGTKPGKVVWASEFHIAHRVVDHFSCGNVYLAGDAAHLHSPIGGRGMNLGIEDACVFAHLAIEDHLGQYHSCRHPVVRKVVSRISQITEIPRGKTIQAKAARTLSPLLPFVAPLFVGEIGRFVLGLDHEI